MKSSTRFLRALDDLNKKINQQMMNLEAKDVEKLKPLYELIQQQTALINQLYTCCAEADENLKQSVDTKMKIKTKQLMNLHDDLDFVHDSLSKHVKRFQDLDNDNELLLGALINMKTNFDNYMQLQAKERIMNTAIITVLTLELLSLGIIDGNRYTQMLKNVINQVLIAYQKAGCSIDFSQELQVLDEVEQNTLAIQLPSMLNMHAVIPNDRKQENTGGGAQPQSQSQPRQNSSTTSNSREEEIINEISQRYGFDFSAYIHHNDDKNGSKETGNESEGENESENETEAENEENIINFNTVLKQKANISKNNEKNLYDVFATKLNEQLHNENSTSTSASASMTTPKTKTKTETEIESETETETKTKTETENELSTSNDPKKKKR